MDKIIEYNGEKYYLSTSRKYYASAKHKSLHRQIWIDNYGEIPKGYAIHHKDGNCFNNNILNLISIIKKVHQQEHMKERMKDQGYVDKLMNNLQMAQEKAKLWHKSEEGKEWHKKQYIETLKKARLYEHVCLICNKKFLSRRKHKAYTCCQDHAYKYRDLKIKNKRKISV
jgi:hypothetical protein